MSLITLKDSDEQIEIEHHFKIAAGPGSGKTRWLINHVKNVLNNSTRLGKCRKIACITFTTVGIETIIKRLNESVGKVEVSTIHSFLYKHLVKPYLFLIAEEYSIDPKKVDGHDELTPTKGLLQQWKKKTDQSKYIDDDRKVIEGLKNLQWKLTNDNCLKLKINDGWKIKFGNYGIRNSSLITYKQMQWERGKLHHDDVLFFSFQLVKKYPSILRVLRAKFPYFFIDEFQDTNPIQTRIIECIAEKQTIIGVIGDKAQSIYEFQGADVRQFENFTLPGLRYYELKNNYRSTQQIITVLNNTRKDLKQTSPSHKSGNKPTIIVSNPFEALNNIKKDFDEGSVYCLSYSNLTSNELKYQYASGTNTEDPLLKILIEDNDNKRPKVVVATIKAIEYARQNRFKEAIKEISKFIEGEKFVKQRRAIIVLKKLLDDYEAFNKKSVYELQLLLKNENAFKFTRIKENMDKPSKVQLLYSSISYKDCALFVNVREDNGLYRTIHKSKGDEFNNVLIIVKENGSRGFSEKNDLSFLLNPDIGKVDHRVMYVAMSRAKDNLFINVPILSHQNQNKLKAIGFEVSRL